MQEHKMKARFIILFSIMLFLTFFIPAGYASPSMMTDFLCEIGLKFYQQGRYDEALHEFRKALMLDPSYQPALKYIQMIEQVRSAKEAKEEKEEKEVVVIPPTFKPISPTPKGVISETLDFIELQREMIIERQLLLPKGISPPVKITELVEMPVIAEEKMAPPKIITLEESLSKIPQPIEIEQGKNMLVVGKNIKRFLVTQPEMLTIERGGPDKLLLTGKEVGYTYVHVWDDNGRWTTEWLTVFPKPVGPTYEELLRREEERARNFRLRYTLSWTSFESGRRIDDLERGSYSWLHGLTLNGPSPYGDIDSIANIRRLQTSTDLTYFTLGLSNGQIGPFKGFNLRSFDYSPGFSNLAFPGATLRGVMVNSPAFDKKLDYTTFWGREGGGRYGNLSPGLTKTKNSFLEGFNLSYTPVTQQNYRFSLLHGHGRDRDNYLNHYGYDLSGSWGFDKWGLGYEIASDSETLAHLLNARYNRPKLNLTAELRNISKDYLSITGRGWRQGELGGLLSLSYRPTDKLITSGSLDVSQDRLSPAPDNDNRWNENFNWDTSYQLDPETSLNLNYSLQNELGRLSQYRYQTFGLGAYKRIKFIKDISAYANYYHQENKSFSSPASDYINNRIITGIRFSLIGELYYYLNKELNWLEVRYSADRAHPNATETGLDWSNRLGKSPFYGNIRFTYRDEEDTVSPLSFLAGEDYIEGYSELSYRPSEDKELYGSCRVRNAWADNPNVTKRVEASFNAGMRYLWDTGVRWESVGNIEGYVFRDLNSDGLRQRDEPPVEGIKIWLGKDKSQVTDLFGYYKFKGVKARKVYVNLDTSTLPPGFVLTVPVTQEVGVVHHRFTRVDFGIISRSEIRGIVFEDVDNNGEYSRNDKGIAGVVITLEDGTEVITDTTGRYIFSHAATGEHTLSLDLNSLPIYYLPQVPIKKDIGLFEGVTYIHNIPLKRVKE